jgi:hypothetical protein
VIVRDEGDLLMGPGLEVQTFERTRVLGRRFFFRIVDTENWKILAPSQTYKTCRQRDETAHRLARLMNCPVVPERRKR